MAQVGLELEKNFEGKASNLVDSCGKSAEKLVTLVTRHFPGIFVLVLVTLVVDMEIVQMGFLLYHDKLQGIVQWTINLLDIVGFRDHSVYKGHQVFLYKRAQIFAADLWGAFKGKGYGEFNDIGEITIFADYIVPAVLRQLGVLKYSAALAATIEANVEIGSGSEEEVELRACSVCAVEKMRELIQKKSGKQVCLSVLLNNIFLP